MITIDDQDGDGDRITVILQQLANVEPKGRTEISLRRAIRTTERAINALQEREPARSRALLWGVIETLVDTLRRLQQARCLRQDADNLDREPEATCSNG